MAPKQVGHFPTSRVPRWGTLLGHQGQVAVLRLHAASTSHVTDAAYSCLRGAYVRYGTKSARTSENSVWAKFAECGFSALGPSFFDGTAPANTLAHHSDGQCQRSRLRHLLYPATTCSMPMPRTRLWVRVYC